MTALSSLTVLALHTFGPYYAGNGINVSPGSWRALNGDGGGVGVTIRTLGLVPHQCTHQQSRI
jgi:hypothetical protein